MDIESSFIVKLIQTGDYDTVDKLQIKPSYFFGTNRRAFKFIVDFKTKYGKVPSLEEFSKKFKKFSFKTELEEPLAFYCDEVRRKTKHNTIAEALEEAREKMNDLDTDGAYKVLTGTVLKIEKDVILGDTKYLNEDTDKRKEAYLRKKLCGGITGIPTGIEAYDYITGGLGETDLVTFLGFTGIGKANPISTPILTPCGFIPMGDVKIGTKVIGEDGKPYDVTAIYPQGVIDVYELTFNDGSKARCSKEHLWKFKAKSNKHGTWEVNTLGNLMEKYKLKIGKAWNLSIPVNKSISFESKGDLIIDPYVLGVLLGDGGFTTDRITLTNPEKDIINKCQIKLKEWGKFTHHVGTNCQYCFKSNNSRKNKLYRKVKDLNLIKCSSKDKFIPKDYLYASIEDRKELLNGLMDTDGHVSKRGSFSFFTTSKQLKDDFIFLCRSLGYRCRVYIDHRPSKGNDCYKISILTDDVIVSSKKHLNRLSEVPVGNRKYSYDNLKITNIKLVGKEECQCITVNSKDHTYICDDFIVTHNTWTILIMACNLIKAGYKVLFITREMGTTQIVNRADAIMCPVSYKRFSRGNLTPDEEEKYFAYLDNLKKSLDNNLVIELATGGVSNVSALVDKHKPDVVFIDGGYLMTDDSDDKDWSGIIETWRGFKQIALNRKIPVVVTMQLKENKANLNSIAFARYIAQDCDNVFGMEQSEEMHEEREVMFKSLKTRDSERGGKFILHWDFDKMDWSPIYTEKEVSEEDMPKNLQKVS